MKTILGRLGVNPPQSVPLFATMVTCRGNIIRLAFIGELLLLFVTGVASGQAPSPSRPASTTTPALGESSRAVLELKLQTIAKEIGDLEDEVKQLESFQAIVRSALTKIDAPGAVPSIDQQVDATRSAFQK